MLINIEQNKVAQSSENRNEVTAITLNRTLWSQSFLCPGNCSIVHVEGIYLESHQREKCLLKLFRLNLYLISQGQCTFYFNFFFSSSGNSFRGGHMISSVYIYTKDDELPLHTYTSLQHGKYVYKWYQRGQAASYSFFFLFFVEHKIKQEN